MKTMKNTLKCLVAVFMVAMAFVVTGITAKAAIAGTYPTYNPAVYQDLAVNPGILAQTYPVPAKSEVVIPVAIPGKGGLEVAYMADTTSDIYVRTYADPSLTQTVSGAYIGYVGAAESDVFCFNNACVIYLLVENDADYDLNFYWAAAFTSGDNRTLSSGKTTAICSTDYNTYTYNKFKATKTGYIAVSAAEVGGGSVYVKLLNNKKQALSDEEYVNNGTLYYGVQKGKTYYIATRSSSENLYNLRVKQTQIKEKSGSSKAKAVTIKKNKTVKGVQIANKKKSGNDWYKIYLPSSKKVKFTIKGGATNSGYSSSDIEMKLIPANSNYKLYGNYFDVVNGKSSIYTSSGTLRAGTYYIQVYKEDKLSSGWYSIKWK